MKKMLFIAVIALVSLASCKKEDMSKYATKEDMSKLATKEDLANSKPKVKTYTFSLTFNQNITWGSAPSFYKEKNDIVLTFIQWDVLGGEKTWTQCPITIDQLTVVPELTENTLFINMVRSDGQTGSPFNQTVTQAFKVVVIPANEFNPNVDYSNYKEVAHIYNVE